MHKIALTIIAIMISASSLFAAKQDEIIITTVTETTTTTLLSSKNDSTRVELDNVAMTAAGPSHFTWGADLGSSFDLTNQEMTSFDLSACFGYRNRSLRFLGIGAGIHMMINNSSRAYPVYLQCRTTFTSTQKFIFLEAKAGVSFITLYNDITRRPLYAAVGIGFTLASGRNFSSHITLGYSFTPLNDIQLASQPKPMKDLHEAVIRLGVAF